MCGIAGIVGFSNHRRDTVRKMIGVLEHRGPDGIGFHDDDELSLGQSRLSINDIVNGRQPMQSNDGNLLLVANGEIYNSPQLRREFENEEYRFNSHSDVEVILPLYQKYGDDCVNHLSGMFAFAVWDSVAKTLFLARDHLGQKPMFFHVGNGGICFASEAKAIVSSGLVKPQINREALWHYMSMRYIPDDMSLFAGIQKLPAATTLRFQDGQTSSRRYWQPDFTRKHQGSDTELVAELDQRLQDTVSSHQLSDVQVGAFLSGGIDSSILCAMMAGQTGNGVPAFSIGVKERGWNEIPFARQVADRYKMNLQARTVSADLVNLIPNMVYHLDEPADPYGVGVYLVARLAAESVKVVLTGDGGDESFAGYDRYMGQSYIDLYSKVPGFLRNQVVARGINLIPVSFGYKSFSAKAKWLSELANSSASVRYADSLSYLRFTTGHKEQLFSASARSQIEVQDSNQKILQYFNAPNADQLVDRMLYTDLMTRIPDHLCAISDRMSMAHSLENRSPFLDHELVTWSALLPAHLKLHGRHLKVALRKLGYNYLPDNLVTRKKQGFGFPIAEWLRTTLAPVLDNAFRESRLVQLGLFEPGYMDTLKQQHLQGKVDHNFRLWMLLNLEIWYRMHIEGESIAAMTATIDGWMTDCRG